jgi:hypothetical protein
MATIGEANYESTTILNLLEEGASIFRFNAAHIETSGSDASELRGFFGFGNNSVSVEDVLYTIRRYEVERQQPITTYLDLGGPKIRVEEVISLHKRFADVPPPRDNLKNLPLNYYPHPQIGDMVRIYKKALDHVEIRDRHRTKDSVINKISKGEHLSEH